MQNKIRDLKSIPVFSIQSWYQWSFWFLCNANGKPQEMLSSLIWDDIGH